MINNGSWKKLDGRVTSPLEGSIPTSLSGGGMYIPNCKQVQILLREACKNLLQPKTQATCPPAQKQCHTERSAALE